MRARTLAILGGALVVGALLFGTFGTALAQAVDPNGWGYCGGYSGPGGTGGNSGPGGWGMGPGGRGMGPGMMGGWWGSTAPTDGKRLSIQEAKKAAEDYVARIGTPGLGVTEVMEFERNFYAIVGDPATGKGAMELLVDKASGNVFPEYGPGMMWNTQYGHMGGFGGMMGGWWGQAPGGEPTVSAERAEEIAQQWLDSNQQGTRAGHPDQFPGYYTLHTERDGKVTGMLSVNGYTGQVWYHNWHGDFVGVLEG